MNGFKKCSISNALDGSEDDCLWQEVSEDENESDEEDDDEDVQDICLDMEEVEIC